MSVAYSGRRRAVVAVFAIAALPLVVALATGGAGAADGRPNVTLTVDNENPWVNETFDVTVTVENPGEEPYDLDEIVLADETGSVDRTEGFGVGSERLRTGDARTVTFEDVSIDEPGEFGLEATARTPFSTGEVVSATETITVRSPDPLVTVRTDTAATASERTVNVSLSNPLEQPIRGVEASLAAPPDTNFTIVDDTDAVPVIEPAETSELAFTIRDATAGSYRLPLELRFETDDGKIWERSTRLSAEFQPVSAATVEVADVSVSSHPNGVVVEGAVFTVGETPASNVRIEPVDGSGVGPARPTPRAFVSSLGGDNASRFELTAELSEDRETIPLRLSYRSAGTTRQTTVEVPYTGPRGDPPVALTRANVAGTSVSGEVANTGNERLAGVTVRIADAENVTAGEEFFVGSIPAGSFQPLEALSFQLTGDRATIPVEIQYTLNDTQYVSTVELDASGASPTTGEGGGDDTTSGETPEFDPGSGGNGEGTGDGGLPVVGNVPPAGFVGTVVVAVVALGGAVVYRRR